jgi:polysulfide reductase-like protein
VGAQPATSSQVISGTHELHWLHDLHALIKPPVWTWEIPVYFFVGGAAGAAAVIAGLGRLTGADPTIIRDAHWIAAVGAAISPLLLISDLGRPARFVNMLRVFKLQSPMSVGAWTLVAFTVATFAAIAASIWPTLVPGSTVIGVVADAAAVLFGLILATYTGVLIGATVIPAWSRHATMLPILFGASALGAAVSLLEVLGHRTSALNTAGIGAAALETIAGIRMEQRERRAIGHRPAQSGTKLARAGGWLAGPVPFVLRLAASQSAPLRLTAASCTILGSILIRLGWLRRGREGQRAEGKGQRAKEGKR